MGIGSWEISPLFAWYDFWIGIFYDKKNRRLYILPLPMMGVKIQFGRRKGHLPDIFGPAMGNGYD